MPVITDMQIQKRNKTRVNVYLDGEFAFGLEYLTALQLGLKIGVEVTNERIAQAVFDSECSVAFEKACNYISRCMKTASQVTTYLSNKGFERNVVEYAVNKLIGYGYVDDLRYAELYSEQNSSTKGSRRIKQELLVKGIARETAEQYSEMDGDTALNNATALAEKYMANKPRDIKTLQKLQRYLLGRGYDFDVVNTVVRSYKSDVQ